MDNQVTLLGSNLVIQINKEEFIEEGTGYLLLEELYNLLGNYGIVTANEVNGDTNNLTYLLMGGDTIFFLDRKNIKELKEFGKTVLINQGILENFIDTDLQSDLDFLEWLGWGEEEISNLKNK